VKRVWVLLLCGGALAGCGGGGGRHVVTVQAYGDHPATTVSAPSASPAACAGDGRIFARDAVALLAHSSTNAAYPADLYYTIIREDFADFEARGCAPRYLGAPLRARLTPAQRAALISALPRTMADVVRGSLDVTRG